MEQPDTDQVEANEGTESGGEGVKSHVTGKTVKTGDSSQDNQETQEPEQSDQGEEETQADEAESKQDTYKLPDGREVSADELKAEYEKLLPEFTRRSQRLKELESKVEEREAQAGESARQTVQQDEVLKEVDPEVQEAIIRIVEPEIDRRLERREQKLAQAQREQQFEENLQSLEKEFDGSDGLPKFDRNEVLRAMQADDNSNYDPREKFLAMHQEDIIDHKVNQALKQKSGGRKSEKTGTSGKSKKPESSPPKDFDEAARRAEARVSS